MAKTEPSLDQWLAEAKADPKAAQCGMFLTHNGVVRVTPKKQVREGVEGPVSYTHLTLPTICSV